MKKQQFTGLFLMFQYWDWYFSKGKKASYTHYRLTNINLNVIIFFQKWNMNTFPESFIMIKIMIDYTFHFIQKGSVKSCLLVEWSVFSSKVKFALEFIFGIKIRCVDARFPTVFEIPRFKNHLVISAKAIISKPLDVLFFAWLLK